MKKKWIESIPVLFPGAKTSKKSSKIIVKAQAEKGYLILDLFREQKYMGRYALNMETGEYAFKKDCGKWNVQKLLRVMGYNPQRNSPYESAISESLQWETSADKKMIQKAFGSETIGKYLLGEIDRLEANFAREKRCGALNNKYRSIDRMMGEITDTTDKGYERWLYEASSTERYLFWNRDKKTYSCSNCGSQIPEKRLGKAKQGEHRICPECGKNVLVKKRTQNMYSKIRVCKLERVNPEYGVARHYKATLRQNGTGCKIHLEEEVRLLLYRKGCEKKSYMIFYNQKGDTNDWYNGLIKSDWYTSNPQNERMGECFLYPAGIREALKGTRYESLTNAFVEMAERKLELDYNAIMAVGYKKSSFGTMLEYLAKGRFYRLCRETAQKCWAYDGSYSGSLLIDGISIEETMGLEDKQKINRLREENGGYIRLEWLRYTEKNHCKISRDAMDYLEGNKIKVKEIESLPEEICLKMSVEQIVNYIKKQTRQGYETPGIVLNQWTDYLYMCKAQNKSLDEELFYKPRNLKEKHDELVIDGQKLEIVKRMNADPELRKQEARKMEEKFSKASAVMKEVKEKYEYAAEGYQMIMPESPIEIVREGYALHHCAGSSERYFNRIENRETFIGFLRRQQEPLIPFYTIEFEPGGTIRQNRSYYDEEPGIEEIRGFLKLWQKEIKKRLTEEDKEHAAKSAVLREQNIKELQEKNNSFVLKKLEEDFMEAV